MAHDGVGSARNHHPLVLNLDPARGIPVLSDGEDEEAQSQEDEKVRKDHKPGGDRRPAKPPVEAGEDKHNYEDENEGRDHLLLRRLPLAGSHATLEELRILD